MFNVFETMHNFNTQKGNILLPIGKLFFDQQNVIFWSAILSFLYISRDLLRT